MADQLFFGLLSFAKIGLHFADFGGPGGPGGPNSPSKLWGSKRPTSWKVNGAAGAAGTPQIDGIIPDFETYSKPPE